MFGGNDIFGGGNGGAPGGEPAAPPGGGGNGGIFPGLMPGGKPLGGGGKPATSVSSCSINWTVSRAYLEGAEASRDPSASVACLEEAQENLVASPCPAYPAERRRRPENLAVR